jgi:ABC-type antimicrobial peptide transport system permease subunit
MDHVLSSTLAPQQFNLLLLGLFAVLALVLSAVGLYGVTAYFVGQRTREIGLRMALGAGPGVILRMVLRQGGKLVALGIANGLAGALAASRVMSGLLYGIGANDPVTFSAAALLLAVVALVACYLPARRATRVVPIIALRSE